MRSRMLFVVFAAMTILLACCGAAQAEQSGAYSYSLNDNGNAVITGYSGRAADVKIPWNLDGHLVTEIGQGAFSGDLTVVTLQIPAGVSVLRENAFNGCENLKSVSLPNRLQTIEDGVFVHCPSLENVTIPENVAEMGEECFDPSVRLTVSPGSLGELHAISGGLAYAYAGETASLHTPPPQNTAEKDYTYRVENNCVTITAYIGKDYEITIPPTIEGFPVTKIGENAFSSCYNAETVILPEGLVELEANAFRFCSYLQTISLPSTLVKIGDRAFFKCSLLSAIVIPEGVTEIGDRAFQECSALKDVTLPASVFGLRTYTFFECHARLTIHAPAGSEAAVFAARKGYKLDTSGR